MATVVTTETQHHPKQSNQIHLELFYYTVTTPNLFINKVHTS